MLLAGSYLAVLLLVYNLFLIPMVWLALYFIRPFEWREYLMPIVGFLFISAYIFTAGLVFEKLTFLDRELVGN